MSRFEEGDGENPVCYMWHANVERVCRGKRGQKILREFVAALLALPERRLIANNIVKDGEVCAVGALAKYRGVLDVSKDWQGDQGETCELGEELGLGFMLSYQLGAENDLGCEPLHHRMRSVTLDVPVQVPSWHRSGRPSFSTHERVSYGVFGYSPEERWQHLYSWACSRIEWNLPELPP